MALGAFLAGMVVGQSDFSLRAASEALPMRDAFAVLFFVSIGMLLDPRQLFEAPGLVAATLAIILIGKPLAALTIVILLRYPIRIALTVAVALAQIGEFSFILATLGRDLRLLDDGSLNVLVGSSIISITLNPLWYAHIGGLEARLRRRPQLWRWLNRRSRSANLGVDAEAGKAVGPVALVVGYGPVGQTLTRLLMQSEITPVVIELNIDTVRRISTEGIEGIHGDASQREILAAAGVERAITLILTAAGMPHSQELIRIAHELNPRIRVLARSLHLRDAADLRHAGADIVFSGEGEVALAMTEHLLRQVGATPEQIDLERERIRGELFVST